jgi:hypothetical protein
MAKWEKQQYNFILKPQEGDHCVSYNPDVSRGLSGMMDALMGLDQKEETALCVQNKYYILNGDHREAFGKRIESLGECIAYFESLPRLHAPTSDMTEVSCD